MAQEPASHFYYRDGCHLCEQMAAFLFREWPVQAAAMQWRDVDADPQWRELYGLRVPVLVVGGEVVCELQPDGRRIAGCFGRQPSPL